MSKKKKTVLATDKDGKRLYVQLNAVMHPLCAMCDGLPLTFFGREKQAYLDIDTAIAWAEKECRENPAWAKPDRDDGGAKILEALKVAKARFERGEVELQG